MNPKGFSLIELMVVIAIIGILATIAIPSYQVYQAQARQREGQLLLSGYFTASMASKIEYGGFAGNFTAIGFNPAGELGYRVRAADTSINPQFGPNDDGCIETNDTCSHMNKSWVEKAEITGSPPFGSLGVFAPQSATVTASAFRVFASGVKYRSHPAG